MTENAPNKLTTRAVIVLFLASCFLCEGATIVKKSPTDKCSCNNGRFSADQLQQLKKTLQGEAVNLRAGLKMMCSKPNTAKWRMITSQPVCFGAKNDQFGSITVPFEGFAAAFKLQHTSGSINCNRSSKPHNSKWGSGHGQRFLNTYLTTASNRVLFPLQESIQDQSEGWYKVPDVDPNSPVLVFHEFSRPFYLKENEQLRLWHGSDLLNNGEEHNSGTTCAHVFVWYI